jgi:hypothetical protein
MQKQGVDLSPELWLVKLLLGAIDSSYDRKDEKSGGRPPQQGYGAPGGAPGYGAPPQQQYGAPPQQQYGAPPQQQYGAPPQQQYGQRPPQQGGYPPQQGGYPPQGGAGGYGAPAPPRY